MVTSRPAASDTVNGHDAATSTPTIRVRGDSAFSAMAMPLINPPPLTGTSTSSTTAQQGQGQGQGQVVAQAVLAPIGKSFKGTGAALVYQSGNQALAVVRAKLPPSTGKNKYVLWLYNSDKQLQPLAADVTDKQGNFQGAAGLPNGWQNYRFFDVTYQATSGKNVGHGRSVMRGPITAPQQQNGSGSGTGLPSLPSRRVFLHSG